MFRGKPSPQNPWQANTLEWTTPMVPPHGNWPGPLPIVYRWPYDYSKPGAADDFIPQTVPLRATPDSNLPHEQAQVAALADASGSPPDPVAPGIRSVQAKNCG